MKIEITEEMREALREIEDMEYRAWKMKGLGMGKAHQAKMGRRAHQLARLLAEAVEEEESKPCIEELCGEPRVEGDIRCKAHAEEMRIERERYLSDKRAGKPCVACVFVGSECADCQDYREIQAEKGGGDA